jgi:methionyl-tRNA formyltransferase
MRIIIITQDDPFYLAESLDYLIDRLPSYVQLVSTVVLEASPFGKKGSFLDKMKKTLKIFGIRFFFHYSMLYIFYKLDKRKNVIKVLHKHKIPVLRVHKSINHNDSLETISSYKPDLLISIAANQIFKRTLLDIAPKGCLNLHTALLPKYRGLLPTFWVLKNNEKETGISLFFMDEGIDSGPILVQKRIEIRKMTQSQLIKISKRIGMDAIVEAIEEIQAGHYKLIPNKHEEMTYFSFPTREDVRAFIKAGKRFF